MAMYLISPEVRKCINRTATLTCTIMYDGIRHKLEAQAVQLKKAGMKDADIVANIRAAAVDVAKRSV